MATLTTGGTQKLTPGQKRGLQLGHKLSPEERKRLSTRPVELHWKADKLSPEERNAMVAELEAIRALPKAERAAAYQEKLGTVLLKVPFLMDLMPAPELIKNATQLCKLVEAGNEAFGLNADKRGTTVVNVGLLGAGVQAVIQADGVATENVTNCALSGSKVQESDKTLELDQA